MVAQKVMAQQLRSVCDRNPKSGARWGWGGGGRRRRKNSHAAMKQSQSWRALAKNKKKGSHSGVARLEHTHTHTYMQKVTYLNDEQNFDHLGVGDEQLRHQL